ncbi:HAMP domain-containing protein [Paenibacillus albicereus]|uniref:histidine kinase n=1 Tax=Paenibacillus albicereus TaxID=2726185 RepID=A0A6H2GY31_9BACL|nr:ATP-binding protein [Paenibacillus albicereus]QJC52343.1 HAMP domain-containing protein [Paenibacillus albicereus]
MIRNRLNSISVKLGAVWILLFMVLLMCIGSLLYMFFIRFYTENALSEQVQRNESYAAVLNDHFDQTTMAHVLLTESRTDNLLIVVDQFNTIKGASKAVESLPDDYRSDIIYHGQNKDRHGPVINSDWKNEPYFVTEAFVEDDGKTIGRIILLYPTEPIQSAIKTLRETFVGIAILAVVCSAVLIFLISGKIVQPLLRMIRITKQISEGRHDWDLGIRGSDEIAQLANAIRRMSANLQQYKEQRRQFLADISHELRTPLTYMKGYSEVLHLGLVQEKQDRDRYLQLLYHQSVQMQRLVEDLFELAHLEQDSFKLTLKRVSLDKIIHHALELMAGPLDQKNIALSYSPSPTPLYVEGDDRRLHQVIVNLLDNALKYTPSGGEIAVSTSQDGHLAIVQITDTGVGIPHEELPRIWERLYRVDKSRSRATGGTGLGLAICHEIIQLHHGSIAVESEEDKGSQFRVGIPLSR